MNVICVDEDEWRYMITLLGQKGERGHWGDEGMEEEGRRGELSEGGSVEAGCPSSGIHRTP